MLSYQSEFLLGPIFSKCKTWNIYLSRIDYSMINDATPNLFFSGINEAKGQRICQKMDSYGFFKHLAVSFIYWL